MKLIKKAIMLLLIVVATAPMTRGQKFDYPLVMEMLQHFNPYIYESILYGDSLTGIVINNPRLGSRDIDLYASCHIVSIVDNNGNTYTNEIHSDYAQDRHDLWLPIAKGFFTENEMNAVQGLIIPTTIKKAKKLRLESNLTHAYNSNDFEFNKTIYATRSDVTVRWSERGLKKAQHPAEYYFSKKRGVDEIVEGTTVNRYRGRTLTKERPLLIHLLGTIGNSATGEVCFIFSIYGNGTDEKLAISQLTAFDEDGQTYRYVYDWTSPSYHRIGRKYGYVELSFKPFRVPVGTESLQKVKLSGKSETYSYDESSEYDFEWINVPIQWVNPK